MRQEARYFVAQAIRNLADRTGFFKHAAGRLAGFVGDIAYAFDVVADAVRAAGE